MNTNTNNTRTMTEAEFIALVGREGWRREQHIEVTEREGRDREEYDEEREEPVLVTIPHVWGFASVTHTLGAISVEYQECWSYDENDEDSFVTGTDGMDTVWTIKGCTVVDEDGDELSQWDIALLLPGAFSDIDYAELKAGINEVTDIDTDEESDMETITVHSDNAPALRFKGERIARTSSSPDTASGYYSGSTGRYTILELYRTASGKYICHSIGVTQWQGEHDRHKAAVCETVSEIIQFFGHGWLAKDLYEEAGIEDVTEVE